MPPSKPQIERRHRQHRVLVQQLRPMLAHVVALERVDVLLEQGVLRIGIEPAGTCGSTPGRSPNVARARCSVLLNPATVSVVASSVSQLRGAPHPQHVAQDQHLARVARWEPLQRGHERQPQRLALDSPSRPGRKHPGVGHRTEPTPPQRGPSAMPRRVERRGSHVHRERPPPAAGAAGFRQTLVAMRNSHALERPAALVAIEAPPRPHHRLLHGVVGLERRAEHPVAVGGQRPAVDFESVDDREVAGSAGRRGRGGASVAPVHAGPRWFVAIGSGVVARSIGRAQAGRRPRSPWQRR